MPNFTTDLPNLASELFDGEVVIADFVSGTYFSLAGTGAAIWQALKAGHSTQEITAWLTGHFSSSADDIPASVGSFVDSLQQNNLIAPAATPAEQAPFPVLTLATFSEPLVEAHTDLADLLLLDPVHDVAEAGWPHLPPAGKA